MRHVLWLIACCWSLGVSAQSRPALLIVNGYGVSAFLEDVKVAGKMQEVELGDSVQNIRKIRTHTGSSVVLSPNGRFAAVSGYPIDATGKVQEDQLRIVLININKLTTELSRKLAATTVFDSMHLPSGSDSPIYPEANDNGEIASQLGGVPNRHQVPFAADLPPLKAAKVVLRFSEDSKKLYFRILSDFGFEATTEEWGFGKSVLNFLWRTLGFNPAVQYNGMRADLRRDQNAAHSFVIDLSQPTLNKIFGPAMFAEAASFQPGAKFLYQGKNGIPEIVPKRAFMPGETYLDSVAALRRLRNSSELTELDFFSLSPNGKYRAQLHLHWGASKEQWQAQLKLVSRDCQTDNVCDRQEFSGPAELVTQAFFAQFVWDTAGERLLYRSGPRRYRILDLKKITAAAESLSLEESFNRIEVGAIFDSAAEVESMVDSRAGHWMDIGLAGDQLWFIDPVYYYSETPEVIGSHWGDPVTLSVLPKDFHNTVRGRGRVINLSSQVAVSCFQRDDIRRFQGLGPGESPRGPVSYRLPRLSSDQKVLYSLQYLEQENYRRSGDPRYFRLTQDSAPYLVRSTRDAQGQWGREDKLTDTGWSTDATPSFRMSMGEAITVYDYVVIEANSERQ